MINLTCRILVHCALHAPSDPSNQMRSDPKAVLDVNVKTEFTKAVHDVNVKTEFTIESVELTCVCPA